MDTTTKTKITVERVVKAPVEKIWNFWSAPEHITQWCNASEDWHAPHAENDLRPGGKFTTRMEAKDGSFGFGGVYDEVIIHTRIAYTLGDDRKVEISFREEGAGVLVTEIFEAETQNPVEMQKTGWQAILNNFAIYTESNS